MPLTTQPCQKYVDVVHKETGERRPATVQTDGTVIDKDGSFKETVWEVSQPTSIKQPTANS